MSFFLLSSPKESEDCREFEMKFTPTDDNSQKTKTSMPIFKDGDAEMWCKWGTQDELLIRLCPALSIGQQKQKAALMSLFRGKDA
jgi:hypothetical protein